MEIPQTPGGRQLTWLLDALRHVAATGTLPDDAGLHFTKGGLGEIDMWVKRASSLSDFELVRIGDVNDRGGAVELRAGDGTAWLVNCAVEEPPPHVIEFWSVTRTLPGLTSRLATEADGPALAELERRVPMRVGDRLVTIDRGDDWFAASRLMARDAVAVGEVDGRLVGMYCGAVFPTRVNGKVQRRFIAHRLRMAPETQGTGVWRTLSILCYGTLDPYAIDASITYVSPDNPAWRRVEGTWSFPALRALIDTAAHAGPTVGRPATVADAEHVVAVLNTGHADEEGYAPYTAETLGERLSRAPAQYGWDSMWLHGDAVVGVWPAGDTITVTTEEGGRRMENRRAHVLDFGFRPGAEDDFAALLGAWCSWSAERGLDQLALFTSEGSPGHDAIRELAHVMEPFSIQVNDPEPPDARSRGWYVDHIYF